MLCDSVFAIASNKELGAVLAKKVIIAICRMGKPNRPAYRFPPKVRSRLNFNLDRVEPNEKVLIVGGGDTADVAQKAGDVDEMTFVSTGGGASLNLIEGKILPGIAALEA